MDRSGARLAPTPSPAPHQYASERHADLLGELLAVDGIRADLVPDAHLAAIALGHGLTVMSNDGDFARFPGVRWENPLADRR